MKPIPENHPLHRWFAVLIETNFQEKLGISTPPVLDYLTELLTEFVHVERINQLNDGNGNLIAPLADGLSEAGASEPAHSDELWRDYHRHLGDFSLFWTGIYPENLRRMGRSRPQRDLVDYLEQGKRSYSIASDLSTDETKPPASVLRILSEQFEYCVYGLGLVRKDWERGTTGGLDSFDLLAN